MLLKPLTTAPGAVGPRCGQMKFPSPRDGSSAFWNGNAFSIGAYFTRILAYDVDAPGWTEELTELHEDVDDEDHYMSVASREQAVLSLERWLAVQEPVILDVGCSTGYTLGLLR